MPQLYKCAGFYKWFLGGHRMGDVIFVLFTPYPLRGLSSSCGFRKEGEFI